MQALTTAFERLDAAARDASDQLIAFSAHLDVSIRRDVEQLSARERATYWRLRDADWPHIEALNEIKEHPRTAGWPR